MTPQGKLEQPRFDESAWPLVMVTPPEHPLDEEAFEAYLADVYRYYTRGEPLALVFDIRRAPPFSAEQRRRIAEIIQRATEEYPTLHVVRAVVLASAVQRGIMAAIAWMAPTRVPMRAFATPEEAKTWSLEQLRAAPTTPTPISR